jgi:16S rRNA (uracil1498-N3)-methyltransferase
MPQYFITSASIDGASVELRGDDYHHLMVRRARKGEEITLRDESGTVYRARITTIGEDRIIAEIRSTEASSAPPCQLTLCAAVLKNKNFDYLVQKAVEVGVSRIIPVITERTIVNTADREDRKVERWRRIAGEAAKQSLRHQVPEIDEPRSFSTVISDAESPVRIIAQPGAPRTFRQYLSGSDISGGVHLLVGPEGGFSPRELEMASAAGWESLHFGFTCLRGETAAVVLSSIIFYEWSGKYDTAD